MADAAVIADGDESSAAVGQRFGRRFQEAFPGCVTFSDHLAADRGQGCLKRLAFIGRYRTFTAQHHHELRRGGGCATGYAAAPLDGVSVQGGRVGM